MCLFFELRVITLQIAEQKMKSSYPLSSKAAVTDAAKAATAFLFRCLNEPKRISAAAIFSILYNKPGQWIGSVQSLKK